MQKKNRAAGAASLILATFIYGFFGILTRLVGFTLPIFYASWIRTVAMILILLFFILIFRSWKKINKKDAKWIILRSCCGVISFLGSYYSFFHIPIGTAYFIFYGGVTIGGYIMGKIFFQERLTSAKIFSLVVALGGLVLIYSVSFESKNIVWGGLALGAGLSCAGWNTFSKKISDDYSALQLNFLDNSSPFIIYLFFSLFLKEIWAMPAFSLLWLYQALFVLMFLATGQLMIWGFNRLEAQIGSLIMLTEVVFGVILSCLFFHETLSLLTICGGLLILLAIILPEIKFKK